MIESSFVVAVSLEAAAAEVGPDVEAECVHFDILLAHLFLVEEDFLAVGVIPGTLVGIRQDLISLLHGQEELFGLVVAIVLIGMILQGQLPVALCLAGLLLT